MRFFGERRKLFFFSLLLVLFFVPIHQDKDILFLIIKQEKRGKKSIRIALEAKYLACIYKCKSLKGNKKSIKIDENIYKNEEEKN